jgi:plastocyanin
MRRLAVLLTLAVVGLALAAGASSMTATAKLTGTVGPGYSIKLAQGTKKVTKLKAGKYTFVVHDKSAIHNFHLTGPGVNKMTSVPFVGTKTWTVTLKKGTYKFVCDPHKAIPTMRGSFKVT